MKVPSPRELGMPEHIDRWRPGQEEGLRQLMLRRNNPNCKRIATTSAPTGFGKSDLVVGYALWTKLPTCIVTDSRSLQDQYMHRYESIGMVDIRGRRNYPCELRDDPDYSCEQGYAAGCPYKGTLGCPSSAAEMKAASSSLVVTNYDKWTAAKKFGQGMQHFQQVVFDEGHEAPNALARAMQVVINHRERERHVCMDPPANADDMLAWKVWAIDARALVESELKRALDAIRGVSNPPPSKVRHALHMRHLNRRLGIISTCNPDNWVVEETEGNRGAGAFQFDPVRPGRYAESSLLLRVPSILIVSATIRPKTMFLLGQGADSFDFTEYPSEFDPKRNPIYWVPTMRVDSRAGDLSRLWNRLDQVAARRRDRKGIVHTVSYQRQSEVQLTSRFRDQMFLNARGDAPTEMIDRYRASDPGVMLVSPSVGQGHDFPGSDCEWQFLCKVPFPPPSKVLKARTQDDAEYPYYLTMQKMVQIFGRGMRSKEDQCENFIPDDHVEWMVNRYGHLAPKSFHMFFRRVETLPSPPPPL